MSEPINLEAWNRENPPGTRVRYWCGPCVGPGDISRTRSVAWELGDGRPVVLVEGKSGGVALTHVEALRG